MRVILGLLGIAWSASGVALAASPERGTPIVQIGHSHPLLGHAFSPDGRRLLTADDECVIVWDETTGSKLGELRWAEPEIHRTRQHSPLAQFLPDGSQFLVDGTLWDTTTGRRVRALLGDGERLIDLQISPDGAQAVVGVGGGVVFAVDLRTGERIHTLRRQPRAKEDGPDAQGAATQSFRVRAVAFAAEGPWALLQGSHDGALTCWDVRTGERLSALGDVGLDHALASPDGRYYVTRSWEDISSSFEETVVWDSRSGQKVLQFSEPASDRASVKFLPDGRHCVVGIDRRAAELWDLESRQKVRELSGHERPVYAIDIRDEGRTLETRSREAAIVWDVASGRRLREFRYLPLQSIADDDIKRMRYSESRSGLFVVPSPDEKTFLASARSTLHLVDARSGAAVREFRIPLPRRAKFLDVNVQGIDYSPSGRTALVRYGSSHYHLAVLWDVRTGKMLARVSEPPFPESYVQFSPNGRYALTSPPQDPVRLWDVAAGRPLQMIGGAAHIKGYTRPEAAFSPNGEFIFTHGRSGIAGVFFWETRTGRPLYQKERPALPANRQGLIDADDQRSYYRGRCRSVAGGRLWASWYGECPGHERYRPAMDRVVLWDVDRAELVHVLARPEQIASRLCFSPDGRRGAICYLEDSAVDVLFWDVESGNVLHTLDYEGDGRYPSVIVHFTPDGRSALLHQGHRELELWDVESGQRLHTLRDPRPLTAPGMVPRLLPDVLISPDSRHAIADYDSRYAILWDLETAEPEHVFEKRRGHCDLSTDFEFSDDGRRLLFRERHVSPRIDTLWNIESGCRPVADTDFPTYRHLGSVHFDESGFWRTAGLGDTMLFDRDTGRKAFAFERPCRIRPDGKRAIGRKESDGPLCLWDLDRDQPIASFERAASVVAELGEVDWQHHHVLLFYRTLRQDNTSSRRRTETITASVYDTRTGKLLCQGLCHDDAGADVFARLFLPDGRTLITASRDGSAIRWDVETGEVRQTYEGIPWRAETAELTGDGNSLMVRSSDGSYAFWDVETGRPLWRCYTLNNGSRWLTVTPEGRVFGNLEYVR